MTGADEQVGELPIDRWGYLLLMLFLTIAVLIGIPISPWTLVLDVAIVCLTLIIAFGTSRVRRSTMRLAYIGTGLALVLAIGLAAASSYVTQTRSAGGIYAILATLLLISPVVILARIVTYDQVTVQSLLAALSAYLMIGLFFAFLYLSINSLSAEPFFAQGQNHNPAVYVYMSYITMTTTGYGDFTPGTDLGRAFVALETLVGQIFLVTTVARMVSLYKGPTAGARVAERSKRLSEAAEADAEPGEA